MIKTATLCFLDFSLGRILCSCLKASLPATTFPHKNHNGVSIFCVDDGVDEPFIKCVVSAASLIEEISPRLAKVVGRNMEYVIGERPSKNKWLAKFHRHLNGCRVNWTQFDQYSSVVKERFMAAALVHEAYHGECYRIYGNKAYDRAPFERICRNREIRVLKYFISIDKDLYSKEILARIETLKK